jgi:hypothetical protein
MGFRKTLGTFVLLCAGVCVVFAGLGAVLAFGMFAWIGMPILAIGLGLMSAAIAEIEV